MNLIAFDPFKGWSIMDASVVCQMLGFVVHPDNWHPFTNKPGMASQPIWRSQVACTDLDMDITMCEADGLSDHSCNHSMDVSIRCTSATWAGKETHRYSEIIFIQVVTFTK